MLRNQRCRMEKKGNQIEELQAASVQVLTMMRQSLKYTNECIELSRQVIIECTYGLSEVQQPAMVRGLNRFTSEQE
jgi:hypothetical protein